MGTKGARRKILSILHIILKPKPDPNAHPNPQPSPTPTPTHNLGTELVGEGPCGPSQNPKMP